MRIDLRSDTVTRPTPPMRHAIAEAEVGDDVFGDDPTVIRLEAVAAERLGKEAALFVPSGTMANQLAIRLHTQPGDCALMEAGAHPFNHEAGAAAMLWGVSIRPLPGERGMLVPATLAAAFLPPNVHVAPVTLVTCEDTANRGGGTVHPLERLDELAAIAHGQGAATHLDGARLFNAQVASGVAAARRARDYDTVSICLSKGLGAPVGSLLCGRRDGIQLARRFRKALGGGMRQAGVIAAAGLYALEHHVERLSDDHRRAAALAEGLRDAGYTLQPPETNMVFVAVTDVGLASTALAERGILATGAGPTTLRLVTHLDVDDAGVATTIAAFRALAPGLATA